MFSSDMITNWKIHKKLLDGGGLGPVVYILPARGNGKLDTEREKIEKILASGRKVVYGRPPLLPQRLRRLH